jgi:hypothetical protein
VSDQGPKPATATEAQQTGLVRADTKAVDVRVGREGVQLTTIDEMYRWSRFVSLARLAPKGLDTPEQIMVATQMGMELGMSPMESLRSIVVINGLPGLRGETAATRLYGSKLVNYFREWFENLPPAGTPLGSWPVDAKHVIEIERVGWPRERFEFSVGDAMQAKLWQKRGRDSQDTPWITYPKRMLRWRNLGFVVKDRFPEVGHRLPLAEELIDLPAEAFPTRTAPAPDVVDAVASGARMPRSTGAPAGRPPRSSTPPRDPLLDSVAGPAPSTQPIETTATAVEEPASLDDVRQGIREEIARRTATAVDAKDLEGELTGGRGLAGVQTLEDLTAVAEGLTRHPTFGDPEGTP